MTADRSLKAPSYKCSAPAISLATGYWTPNLLIMKSEINQWLTDEGRSCTYRFVVF